MPGMPRPFADAPAGVLGDGRSTDSAATARGNIRWYFAGLTASLIGNSAMSLVAGIWVKALTGSSSEAGLVSASVYAPAIAAPLAGLVADRLPRMRLLFWLNVVSAGTILLLLAVRTKSQVWIVFVVMGTYGIEATLTTRPRTRSSLSCSHRSSAGRSTAGD